MHQVVTEEEKLLFSGEESTASEPAVHIDSGLRIVQLLELGGIQDSKEKDKSIQGEMPRLLPLQKKQQEGLPMDSEFEDISDVSDEGTPERDLPGTLPLK